MNRKITIVLIALIGIGLYALPSTVALFSGQHTFVNIDKTGNQIDCVKCHGDVQTELTTALGTNSYTGTPSAHAAFKCEFCHRIEAGKATGDNAYAELTYTGVGVSRKLVVGIKDMEARNIPVSMSPTDDAAAIANLTTISGDKMGKFSASPCYKASNANCTDPTVVLLPPPNKDMKPSPLYLSGVPKDTSNSTKDGLFDASKPKWDVNASTESVSINLTGAGSRVVNPGTSYHAASLVSCLECHGGVTPAGHYYTWDYGSCDNCHYAGGSKSLLSIGAGGFGLTGETGDTGVTEAHLEFVGTKDDVTRYGYAASNGACIACHTHVKVDITYQKPSVYKFDVNFFTDGSEAVGGHSAQPPMITSHS